MVAEKDMITMSRRDASRLHILHQTLARKVTQQEAAGLIMGLSDRQVRRLIKRRRAEGDDGICHRSRGKVSNHRIPPRVKARVLTLFQEAYRDFNLVLYRSRFPGHDVSMVTPPPPTLRRGLRPASDTRAAQ